MSVSPGNGTSERPMTDVNIVYFDGEMSWYTYSRDFPLGYSIHREVLDQPVILLDSVKELPTAAGSLVRKGTPGLRKHLRAFVKWPAEGSLEDAVLRERVAEMIRFWEGELAGGFSPAEMEDAEDGRFSEADRLIIGWLTNGNMPAGRELIFELAWPFALSRVMETAGYFLPAELEKIIEDEEISGGQAERWMAHASPWKSENWVLKTTLWESYRLWCAAIGSCDPGTPHEFYQTLKALGCAESNRSHAGGRGFFPPRGNPA